MGRERSQRKNDKLLARYVYDILDGRWERGGDAKVVKALSDSAYVGGIPEEHWKSVWQRFRQSQLELKHKRRTKLSGATQVVLRLVYATLQTPFSTSDEIEDDHVIPIAELRKVYPDGGPLNHIGNRALLPATLNKEKGKKYPHKIVMPQDKYELVMVLLTLDPGPSQGAINSLKAESEKIEQHISNGRFEEARKAYEEFVSKRFDKMLEILKQKYGIPS